MPISLEASVDFFALNYSLATLCFVAFVSFLLGRWSKGDAHLRNKKPIGEVSNVVRHKHSANLSADAELKIQKLLERGRLIAAVRVARQDLGIGLKEAKDLIDQLKYKR